MYKETSHSYQKLKIYTKNTKVNLLLLIKNVFMYCASETEKFLKLHFNSFVSGKTCTLAEKYLPFNL